MAMIFECGLNVSKTVESEGMSALDILCSVATNHPSRDDGRGGEVLRTSAVKSGDIVGLDIYSDCQRQKMGTIDYGSKASWKAYGVKSKPSLEPGVRQATSKAPSVLGCTRKLSKCEPIPVGKQIKSQMLTNKLTDVTSPMSSRASRRQSYTRFSKEEERLLVEGVKKYGAGNWKRILCNYQFHCKRTPVDLKDKYRNMMKMSVKRKGKATIRLIGQPQLKHHNGHESDVSNSFNEYEDRAILDNQPSFSSLCTSSENTVRSPPSRIQSPANPNQLTDHMLPRPHQQFLYQTTAKMERAQSHHSYHHGAEEMTYGSPTSVTPSMKSLWTTSRSFQ